MKNGFASGSGAATALLARLDTTVAFLMDRRQTVALDPAGRKAGAAYVWRRVFLKGRDRRA
jgi:hypothetical protein